MKAALITHLNPPNSDTRSARPLASPLETLGAAQYNRRSWRRRLPAVLIASLLLVLVLLAVGISPDGAPLLVLLPLICLPLAAALALGGS
jgi:hypothetical protein